MLRKSLWGVLLLLLLAATVLWFNRIVLAETALRHWFRSGDFIIEELKLESLDMGRVLVRHLRLRTGDDLRRPMRLEIHDLHADWFWFAEDAPVRLGEDSRSGWAGWYLSGVSVDSLAISLLTERKGPAPPVALTDRASAFPPLPEWESLRKSLSRIPPVTVQELTLREGEKQIRLRISLQARAEALNLEVQTSGVNPAAKPLSGEASSFRLHIRSDGRIDWQGLLHSPALFAAWYPGEYQSLLAQIAGVKVESRGQLNYPRTGQAVRQDANSQAGAGHFRLHWAEALHWQGHRLAPGHLAFDWRWQNHALLLDQLDASEWQVSGPAPEGLGMPDGWSADLTWLPGAQVLVPVPLPVPVGPAVTSESGWQANIPLSLHWQAGVIAAEDIRATGLVVNTDLHLLGKESQLSLLSLEGTAYLPQLVQSGSGLTLKDTRIDWQKPLKLTRNDPQTPWTLQIPPLALESGYIRRRPPATEGTTLTLRQLRARSEPFQAGLNALGKMKSLKALSGLPLVIKGKAERIDLSDDTIASQLIWSLRAMRTDRRGGWLFETTKEQTESQIRIELSMPDGRLDATWVEPEIGPESLVTGLLQGLPEDWPVSLDQGRFSLKLAYPAFLDSSSADRFPSLELVAQSLDMRYQQNRIHGADMDLVLALRPDAWYVSRADLSLERVSTITEIRDWKVIFSGIWNREPTATGVDSLPGAGFWSGKLDHFGMQVFGGRLSVPPMTVDTREAVRLPLQIANWHLQQIADLYDRKVEISGTVQGEVPLVWQNGTLALDGGHLESGAEGGLIRYATPGLTPSADLQTALERGTLGQELLRNFRYTDMKVGLDYRTGQALLLPIVLQGSSLDFPEVPVESLNINIEHDLEGLMESVMTAGQIERDARSWLKKAKP